MAVANQRAAPVIYVAGSARELPVEVREWLGRAETRAVASPHIYDMLAELARGKKFAAIIVNIQSVDWSEMEFFDHAVRLSRQTPIYVAGPQQQRAKLDAACRRGALLFDVRAVEEELQEESSPLAEPACDMRAEPAPSPRDAFRLEPFDAEMSVEQPEFPGDDLPTDAPEPHAQNGLEQEGPGEHDCSIVDEGSPPLADPACGTEEAECDNSVFAEPLSEECCDESPGNDEGAPEDPEDLPFASRDRWPVVRLAWTEQSDEVQGDRSVAKPEQPDQAEQSGQGPPVVFPWSTNPNRPKRTPPPAAAQGESEADQAAGTPSPSVPTSGPDSPFRSVRLTPEEIAALMGPTPRRDFPEARS